MDDGYWEALLQDVESEVGLPQPKWEPDAGVGELAASGNGHASRRFIAGPPAD